MEDYINKKISELFKVDVKAIFTRTKPAFGDYATNVAFEIAAKTGKNPREVANQLAENLINSDSTFVDVMVAGPGFINVKLPASLLAKKLNDQFNDHYGDNNSGNGKKVIVEFPSPNMAKPYSVGHLRPGNQGWAAKRLMEVCGWKVITDNHLGDYGAPFGMWVTGFKHYSNETLLEEKGVYELGRIYIEIRKDLKEEEDKGDHALKDEVQDWLIRLDNNDPAALAYKEKFQKISLDHIHKVMARLKISTDYEIGESFYVKEGKKIVQDLIDKGVAIKNPDNSVIVPLDKYGIKVPLLIQKSNGTALYATTDLATLVYREKTWHPDKVIYAVAAEQQFYFKQIFALAKMLGIKSELTHMWFGLIDQMNEDGTREKMSSRKGVVLMEDLLDQADSKVIEMTKDREVNQDDIEKIALGAIKFSDFMADRKTNILFDWKTIFALNGFSGPYVQYAAVRVNRIIHDAGNIQKEAIDLDSQVYDYNPEKKIIMKLLDYPAIVLEAANELAPHKIATYLYELARDLNQYYESTKVLDSDKTKRQLRVEMMQKVSHVFKHGLSILGIEIPSKM